MGDGDNRSTFSTQFQSQHCTLHTNTLVTFKYVAQCRCIVMYTRTRTRSRVSSPRSIYRRDSRDQPKRAGPLLPYSTQLLHSTLFPPFHSLYSFTSYTMQLVDLYSHTKPLCFTALLTQSSDS